MHDGYLAIWIFCCVISERTTQAGRTPCSSQDAIIFLFHIILHLKDKWHKVIFKTLFKKIFIHIIFTCGMKPKLGCPSANSPFGCLETISNLLFRSLRTFLKISNELVFKKCLLIFFRVENFLPKWPSCAFCFSSFNRCFSRVSLTVCTRPLPWAGRPGTHSSPTTRRRGWSPRWEWARPCLQRIWSEAQNQGYSSQNAEGLGSVANAVYSKCLNDKVTLF